MQSGKRAVRIDERAETIAVHFEDGTSEFGNTLVGAEGTCSVVRTHILHGKDVVKRLPLGSRVGDVEFGGDDFAHQLSMAHSGFIIMN